MTVGAREGIWGEVTFALMSNNGVSDGKYIKRLLSVFLLHENNKHPMKQEPSINLNDINSEKN